MGYLGRAVRLEGISETMTEAGSQLDQVAAVCSNYTLHSVLDPSTIPPPSRWLLLCQPAKDRK